MAADLPPLPSFVASALGPVPIILHAHLEDPEDGDSHHFGEFNRFTREIHISQEAVPLMQWQTFFHECVHLALFDAGLHNVIPDGQQEVLCDVLATARVVEMLAQF